LQVCGDRGGCTLLLAKTYLTGPLVIPSDTTVQLDGEILAGGRSWWTAGGSVIPTEQAFGQPAFLNVHASASARNVVIRGTGIINGQGAAWWAAVHDDLAFRPAMALFSGISGLTIEGVYS